MTATPRVFLIEEQVRSIVGKGPATTTHAVGLQLDGGEVFHVHLEPPATPMTGYPCVTVIDTFTEALSDAGACERATSAYRSQVEERAWHGAEHLVVVQLARLPDGIGKRSFIIGRDGACAEAEIYYVPTLSELYTRSQGLLRTEHMRERHVGIVGLGSGGSTIAVELAKAGVGRFTLIDHDRLELGNVARHACGVSDLGRFKTKAVRDRMLDKNPRVACITAEIDINERLDQTEQLLADCHLIIGATDGDRSRVNLNAIALASGTPAIFGRAISRAAGGDVLRVRPHQGPCVACLFRHFEAQPDEISRFDQARRARPDYVSDADVEALVQVGLSNDILPIATMVVKLALLELNRGIDSGLATLEEDLVADLYVWANRRERAFRGFPPMGTGSRTPAILRWYGARTERNPDCQMCGTRAHEAEEDPIFAAAPV